MWGPRDDPETYLVIGAALDVHRELGPGFLEAGYGRCLAMEFENRGIPFEREVALPMTSKGKPTGVPFRVDFVCFQSVLVEIKALPTTGACERRQLVHYLRSSGLTRGLLINFGGKSLRVERAVGPSFVRPFSLESVQSPVPPQS